jgi:hypothetical protein
MFFLVYTSRTPGFLTCPQTFNGGKMIKRLVYMCTVCAIAGMLFNCPSPTGGPSPVYSATALWQTRLGGLNDDYGVGASISGNGVIGGYVFGDADFNSDGNTSDTGEPASGGSVEAFISTYSLSDGSWCPNWSPKKAIRLGDSASNSVIGYGSASDPNYIVIVGNIGAQADLNGDGNSTNDPDEVQSGIFGSTDIFISVFGQDGVFKWAKRLGGNGGDAALGVTVYQVGMSHFAAVTGYIVGDADLTGDGSIGPDSSPTTGELSSGYTDGTSPVTIGGYDAFITVFELSGTGTCQWSKRLGGPGAEFGNGISADSSGNIIVTGDTSGSTDLNDDKIITPSDAAEIQTIGFGGSDIFVSYFGANGSNLWYRRLGGPDKDIGKAVVTDSSDSIYITGEVTGSVDLNGDGDTKDPGESGAAYGGTDVFISAFTSSNSSFWTARLGGLLDDSGCAITRDSNDTIVLTGWVNGSADLNGDHAVDSKIPGEVSGAVNGGEDIFVSAFKSKTYAWSSRLGGIASDHGLGIAADASNHILLTGIVRGNADLNGDGVISAAGETAGANFSVIDIFVVDLVQP